MLLPYIAVLMCLHKNVKRRKRCATKCRVLRIQLTLGQTMCLFSSDSNLILLSTLGWLLCRKVMVLPYFLAHTGTKQEGD